MKCILRNGLTVVAVYNPDNIRPWHKGLARWATVGSWHTPGGDLPPGAFHDSVYRSARLSNAWFTKPLLVGAYWLRGLLVWLQLLPARQSGSRKRTPDAHSTLP